MKRTLAPTMIAAAAALALTGADVRLRVRGAGTPR